MRSQALHSMQIGSAYHLAFKLLIRQGCVQAYVSRKDMLPYMLSALLRIQEAGYSSIGTSTYKYIVESPQK
jgi:hypothetical protein